MVRVPDLFPRWFWVGFTRPSAFPFCQKTTTAWAHVCGSLCYVALHFCWVQWSQMLSNVQYIQNFADIQKQFWPFFLGGGGNLYNICHSLLVRVTSMFSLKIWKYPPMWLVCCMLYALKVIDDNLLFMMIMLMNHCLQAVFVNKLWRVRAASYCMM